MNVSRQRQWITLTKVELCRISATSYTVDNSQNLLHLITRILIEYPVPSTCSRVQIHFIPLVYIYEQKACHCEIFISRRINTRTINQGQSVNEKSRCQLKCIREVQMPRADENLQHGIFIVQAFYLSIYFVYIIYIYISYILKSRRFVKSYQFRSSWPRW